MLNYTRMVFALTLLISVLMAHSPARAEQVIDLSVAPVQSRPTSTPIPGVKTQTKAAKPVPKPKAQVQTPSTTTAATDQASQAPAQNTGSQFSLSLDALYQALIISPWILSPYSGAGGQVFADWRPIQYLSFGAGAQYAYFFGTPTFKLSSFDLGGRIFPLPIGENPSGEFYLQGGVGLNLLVLPPAEGHFHGYAGLGYRQFLGGNLALDMGAQYDFYSPIATASHGAAAKIGLTFLFGRTDWREPEEGQRKPVIRNFKLGEAWTGPSDYTWTVGDNLRKVAARVYGDESFYPLLVDANKGLLADYRNLRPGTRLVIPAPPQTQGEADRVEKSANENGTYLKWQTESEIFSQETAHQPRVSSYQWRYGDNISSVAEKLYGDEDLYPLLVDANEKRIIHPANLVPGKVLRVPSLPPDEKLGDIRFKATTDSDYLHWRNASLKRRSNIGH